MGNTTIIELNHDRWDEIDKNRENFVRQILQQLSTAEYTGQDILGGKVIAFFNRYPENRIYRSWENFKKKWEANL